MLHREVKGVNKMTKTKRYTSYYRATYWDSDTALILCNNIASVDYSVYDNMEFDSEGVDIYQWFLTNLNRYDVDYLEKSFGLLFTYSDMLDCYVLCVDHCGCYWRDIEVEVLNDNISDDLLKED